MFCPNCGAPRMEGAFCSKCGTSFQTVQPDPAEQGVNVLMWVASILSLGGLVWLWLNVGDENMVFKLIIVGFMEAIWIGIVFTVLGLVALLLGMMGFVTKPFWRK